MQFSQNLTNKPSGYLIADIFNEAGQAFMRMGSLTSSLKENSNISSISKWSQSDIERFYNAVKKFSSELNSICTSLDNKVKEEIHNNIEKHVLMETGCITSDVVNPMGWKSDELYDKNKKEILPKSEEHSPDYVDPDDEMRDNYNSEDDNYELE